VLPTCSGVWPTARTLESFFTEQTTQVQRPVKPVADRKGLLFKPLIPSTIPPSYLVSIGYDGDIRKCFLRLYEPKSHKIFFWFDDSGHKPYCFSKQSIPELQKIDAVARNPGFDHFEEMSRFDGLRGETQKVTKIVAKDPLTIGGKPTGSIRDAITAWEADIKYVENYIYDRGIEPGMMYEVKDNRLSLIDYRLPEEIARNIAEVFRDESLEYRELAGEWMRLLECPVPQYRRAAVDIEVSQTIETRVPDPELAEQQVICASLAGSDDDSRIFLLRREGITDGNSKLPPNVKLEFYDTEEELLTALFLTFLDYPIIVTFNGDDFDLKYLYHRAQRLGFRNEEIPIELGRDVAFLRYGVHIDLYKFFFNRSIQIYAFGQRYRENTLDAVGEALINTTKVEIDRRGFFTKAPYTDLAAYCYRDSEIVLNLTSFDDDLVMKLMTALSRISYMTLDDVSRQGVSGWIRSIMFCHHRKRGYLIPRRDEILDVKGKTATEAVIKGKKYKGAIVVEPKPGVHFDVAVLDFASLYPSIIKVWNLGYETVRCPHQDETCRKNLVPGTPHWVCKRKRGLESLLIGSLRDLRVNRYKVRSKDRTLPPTVKSWYKVVSDALKVVLNACFTGDTEVLTPQGPRNITALKVGDEVYTLNEKSGRVEVKPIVECQHFSYDGPLVEIRNQFVDWRVTDNHELYLGKFSQTRRGKRIRFGKSKALLEALQPGKRYLFRHDALQSATDGGTFAHISLWSRIPNGENLVSVWPGHTRLTQRSFELHGFKESEGSQIGHRYRMTRAAIDAVARSPEEFERKYNCRLGISDLEAYGSTTPWNFEPLAFFELIAWYASKGSIQPNRAIRGSPPARIMISQDRKDPKGRQRVISTIERLGLAPTIRRDAVTFNSRLLAELLRDECGIHSCERRLPAFVFKAPVEMRRRLLDSLMQADGRIEQGAYSTVSQQLALDVQHLAFTLGIECKIGREVLPSGSTIYRAKMCEQKCHLLRKDDFRITPVKELDVYCITAEGNHVVYAGRNGKFGWVGQSYGVFGADNFALYCPPVAEATAAIGRHLITQALQKAQDLNLEVFYGDTDSIFLGARDADALNKLIEWSRNQLKMELEIDKNYRYLALSSRKKNYFGVMPDGNVDIKGLTGKKRHIPQFLHGAFYQMVSILSQVKSPEDIDYAKSRLTEIVKECYVKLRNKEYTLDELAFSMMMSRTPENYTKTTPQHVKAARQLQGAGTEMKPGDIISFVKVHGEPGVKPVQLARLDEVDSEKYIEYIRGTFEQVLDSLGVEWEDLAGVKKLESFFGG